jgi:hypothetical protein
MSKVTYDKFIDKDLIPQLKKLGAEIDIIAKKIQSLGQVKTTRKGNGKALKDELFATKELQAAEKELIATEKHLLKVSEESNKRMLRIKRAREKAAKKEQVELQKTNVAYQKQQIERQKSIQLTKKQARVELTLEKARKKGIKTIEDLENVTAALNQKRRKINLTTKEGVKEYKKITSEIDKNTEKLKKLDKAVGKFQRSVGKYIGGLKDMIKAFGILGAVNLVVQGFKALNRIQKENIKTQNILNSQYNLTNSQLKDMTVGVNALSKSFEVSKDEILRASNAMSKEFGISGADALKKIEEGFLSGSNASGEMLEMVREYPAQFKAAGIDADLMMSIINTSVKEGIYSDKGADAIKEGGLRLRENTKAVQEALKPLDESVKKQIEQEIAAGNSFKAIQLVSKSLKDTSLTANQTQRIIADVFGGAGEDAGIRYLQMLSDIDTTGEGLIPTVSELTQKELEFNKTIEEATVSLTSQNGIIAEIRISFYELVTSLINTASELIDSFKEIGTAVSNLFNSFRGTEGEALKLRDVLGLLGKAISKLTIPMKVLNKYNAAVISGFAKLVKWVRRSLEILGLLEKQEKKLDWRNLGNDAGIKNADKAVVELSGDIKDLSDDFENTSKAASDFRTNIEEILKGYDYDLISDTRRKAQTDVQIWYDAEMEKVNNAKGSTAKKNQAIEKLDKLHKRKLLKIETDYQKQQKTLLEKENQNKIKALESGVEVSRAMFKEAQQVEKLHFVQSAHTKEEYRKFEQVQQIAYNENELKLLEAQYAKVASAKIKGTEDMKTTLRGLMVGLKIEIEEAKNALKEGEEGDNWLASFLGVTPEQAEEIKEASAQLKDTLLEHLNSVFEARKEEYSQLAEKSRTRIDEINEEIAEEQKRNRILQGEGKKTSLDKINSLKREKAEQQKLEQKALDNRKKAARTQKTISLTEAIIGTALGMVNSLKEGGIFGIIMAAIVGAMGAIQIAKISNQQFAEGTEYVQLGGNKPGVDTVPALLTEGERVLTRKQNKNIPKWFPNAEIPTAVNDYISNYYNETGMINMHGVEKRIDQTNKLLEKERHIYENGVLKQTIYGNTIINYV